MRKHLCRKETRRKGFTLTEMLVVVGIIAILCTIAVPSIIAINRSLKFKQHNDYAEQLFMAAQTNLTELRSNGGLGILKSKAGATKVEETNFPSEDWSEEYVYTMNGKEAYDFLLPPGCIDEAVRDQNVLVEYNPVTGNVYSVCYSEDDTFNLLDFYMNGLPRENTKEDTAKRKEHFLGYYQGSGVTSVPMVSRRPDIEVTYENGQEGVASVSIKIPTEYIGRKQDYQKALDVELTVTGELTKELKEAGLAAGTELSEDSYSFKVRLKEAGKLQAENGIAMTIKDGLYVDFSFALDSLITHKSFANLSYENGGDKYISELDEANKFKIYPGDNVTLTARARGPKEVPPFAPGILSGVNPLYEYMIPSAKAEDDGSYKYVVGAVNGRNLQNLNIMHPAIAEMVKTVMITDNIDWKETVNAYPDYSKQLMQDKREAPGRCLPYFVPLQNATLFGAPDVTSNGIVTTQASELLAEIYGKDRDKNANQPKLERDRVLISNLDINAGRLGEAQSYYAGEPDYRYTGLFAYLNTRVDNISVVNPKVDGCKSSDLAATGALVGAAGRNARITNCSTYLEPEIGGFDQMNSYFVRGHGAVGGLVGYAENNRVLFSGNLKDHLDYLTFYKCFAAVPVSGTMATGENTSFRNGIGGFVGVSNMANAYDCYSSSEVTTEKTSIVSGPKKNVLLPYSGVSSVGAGGFTGTSHGTRYTNCFATGAVHAKNFEGNDNFNADSEDTINYREQSAGVGSFVGVMCYDAALDGSTVSQWTIFENCYAAGRPSAGDKLLNVFSGCNARINVEDSELTWKDNNWKDAPAEMYSGDYYRLLAPFKAKFGMDKVLEPSMDPQYGGWNIYIYKNTYQYDFNEAAGESSNDCATFISYEVLQDLVGNHQSDAFKKLIIDNVKSVQAGRSTYKALYFDKYKEMEKIYQNAVSHGFQYQNWGAATAKTTHPYDFTKSGQKYPFSKINNLDYYGEWPEKPRSAGLAYYEVYAKDPAGVTYRDPYGIYFDRNGAAKHALKNKGENYVKDESVDSEKNPENIITINPIVQEDGYIFLSKDKLASPKASMGNVKNVPLEMVKTEKGALPVKYAPGGSYGLNSYYVYLIPKKILDEASKNEFYSELKINGRTFYFNPDVALSQVNPAGEENAPLKPGSSENALPAIPGNILIRSARQFREINSMPKFWNQVRDAGHNVDIKCSYLQQLDIDATKYDWNAVGIQETSGAVLRVNPIGVDGNAFNGIYRSQWATIRGFLPVNSGTNVGLFGVVGQEGQIQNVSVEAIAQADTTVGSTSANSTAIVAGRNDGTLNNVHVVLASGKKESTKLLRAVFAARDSDDGPYEKMFEKLYEDKLEDLTDHYEKNKEEINKLAEEIKQTIDKLYNGLSLANQKLFDEKFPKRENWGKKHDDGHFRYDDGAFEDIFEWFDHHRPRQPRPGGNDEIEDISYGPVSFKLQASENAGLLTGTSHGVIMDCTVNSTAKAGLTIDAANAGGLAGYIMTTDGSSTVAAIFSETNLLGDLTLNGTNGGGFVGLAHNSSFLSDSVSLGDDTATKFVVNAPAAGGFAGKMERSSLDAAAVDFLGIAVGSDDYFGGAVGIANELRCSDPAVVFYHGVSAPNAAGLIAKASSTHVNDAYVKFMQYVESTNQAGGMFVSLDSKSVVSKATVDMTLMQGALKGKTAAGFVCVNEGLITNAKVMMHEFNKEKDKDGNPGAPLVHISANGKIAAGFAATMNGGKISDCSVSGSGTIHGADQAAGFVGEVSGKSNIVMSFVSPVLAKDSSVYLGNSQDNLVVEATNEAAGFAVSVQTPSGKNTEYGIFNSYTLGRIKGAKSAGFAIDNAGLIEGGMANVAMTHGHAFAYNTGDGKVRHSYGWYSDGNNQDNGVIEVPEAPQESYQSCYFADLDFIPQKDKETPEDYDTRAKNVFLIDNNYNVHSSARTNLIYGRNAILQLNIAGEAAHWFAGMGENPFSERLIGEEYNYPMLRPHYGDWREPPFPSYGVVYYEVYNPILPGPEDDPATFKPDPSKNIYWIHIKDGIKDISNSLEGKSLDFTGYFDSEGNMLGSENLGKPVMRGDTGSAVVNAEIVNDIDAEKPLASYDDRLDVIDGSFDIYEAGYSLFCKEVKKDEQIPFDESNGPVIKRNPNPAPGEYPYVLTEVLKDLKLGNLTTETYKFYEMDDSLDGEVTIKGKVDGRDDPIHFNTWFADTLTERKPNHYEVRSAEQFKNLAKMESGGIIGKDVEFNQSWDILNQYGDNDDFVTINQFDGKYHGNGRRVVLDSNEHVWIYLVKEADNVFEDRIHDIHMEIKHMKVPLIDRLEDQLHLDSLIIGRVDNFYTGLHVKGEIQCDPARGDTENTDNNKQPMAGSIVREVSGCLVCDDLRVEGPLQGYFVSTFSGGRFLFIDKNGNVTMEGPAEDAVDPNLWTGLYCKNLYIKQFTPDKNKNSGFINQMNQGVAIRMDTFKYGSNVEKPIFHDVSGALSIKNMIIDGDTTSNVFGKVSNMRHNSIKGNLELGVITVNGNIGASLIGEINNSLFDRMVKVDRIWNDLGKPDAQGNVIGLADKTLVKFKTASPDLDISTKAGSVLVGKVINSPIRNVHFEFDKLKISNAGTYGLVAGTMDADSEISNITVENANIEVNGGATFGTLVGNNAGKLSNNTVKDTVITTVGAPGSKTTAGGLVGVNSGDLSENSVVNTDIVYVQPAAGGDSADIGGLVGLNEGGTISNTNEASGDISLDQAAAIPEISNGDENPVLRDWKNSAALMSITDAPETSTPTETTVPAETKSIQPAILKAGRRTYRIGGIVGAEAEDAQAVYENVTSSFHVDEAFASPKNKAAANDPAGQGAVGVFIGYVTDGSFTNCSSKDKDNTVFEFLGEIQSETKQTNQDALIGDGAKSIDTVKGDLEDIYDGYKKVGQKTYSQFNAILDKCYFYKDGKSFEQGIQDVEHYYDQLGTEVVEIYESSDLILETEKLNNVALETLTPVDTDGEYLLTPYFGKDDGEYMPLFVKMTEKTETIEIEQEPSDEEVIMPINETTVENGEETTSETTEPATQPTVPQTITVTTYIYELATMDDDGFDDYGKMVVKDTKQLWKSQEDEGLYKVSLNLENGPYMILNEGGQPLALSEEDGQVYWSKGFKSMKKLDNSMVWVASNAKTISVAFSNKVDPSCYLTRNLTRGGEKKILPIRILEDGRILLGSSDMKLTLKKLTAVKVENPQYTNTFTYIGTAQKIGSVPKGEDLEELLDETKPSETKPVETKPVETKPVETKPVETKPVETKPVETKPSETKPAETKPVKPAPVPTTVPTDPQEGLTNGEPSLEDVEVMD